MEDNLNLDLDEINHLGAEMDLDQSRTSDTTLVTHLNINERFVGQRKRITFHFHVFLTWERRKKGKRASELLSSILGVLPIRIRRAKSLLDEGYAWVQKMRGFTEDPKEEIFGNQGFRAKETSYLCYYT